MSVPYCPQCGRRMRELSEAGHRVRVPHTFMCFDDNIILEGAGGEVRLLTYDARGNELPKRRWWTAAGHAAQ